MDLGQKSNEQRLHQQIAKLEEQWDLLNQILSRLKRDKILKTDTEEIFHLDQRIAELTAERQQVEQQLKDLETQLASAPDLGLVPKTEAEEPEIKPELFTFPEEPSPYKYLLKAIALGLFIFLILFIPYFHYKFKVKTLDWKFWVKQQYEKDKSEEQITAIEIKIVIIPLRDDFMEGDTISREKLAHLISRLLDRTPRVIGLDVLLDESKKGDETLVEAIQKAGNVIIPFELKTKNSGDSHEMYDPLPKFKKVAKNIGFADFRKDPDDVVRTLPLEQKNYEDDRIYYPFTLQILRYFSDPHGKRAIEQILEGNPENKNGILRINFAKTKKQFMILESEDIEKFDKSFYYDKILLIGYLGEKKQKDDEFLTPLSVIGNKKMRGVVVQANILNTICSKQYIRSWIPLDLVIILLFASIGGYLLPKFGWMAKLLILSITWVFYIIITLCLFFIRVDIPLLSPMITLTLISFFKSSKPKIN